MSSSLTRVFVIKEADEKQLDLGFGGPGSAGSREREEVRMAARGVREAMDSWQMQREFKRWDEGPKTTADMMTPKLDPRRVKDLLDQLEANQFDPNAIDIHDGNWNLWENLLAQANRQDEFGRSCHFLAMAIVEAGARPKI